MLYSAVKLPHGNLGGFSQNTSSPESGRDGVGALGLGLSAILYFGSNLPMRACIQRVKYCRVEVQSEIVGEIQVGLLVFLGVEQNDSQMDLNYLVEKICGLRIFEDEQNKMNLSVKEVAGSILVVSQFTLLGNCKKGKRPSFVEAADPKLAKELYEQFIQLVKQQNIPVASGQFQADMQVTLCNDGPVTILIDSRRVF